MCIASNSHPALFNAYTHFVIVFPQKSEKLNVCLSVTYQLLVY